MYTERVAVAGGSISVDVDGVGLPVVMVPSLGRGATDFADLAAALSTGFCVALPDPRGIGASDAAIDGMTMEMLADDVAAVIAHLDAGPAFVVGHAFGNRVARMTAARHPGAVRGVVLLACGGLVPPAPEAGKALLAVFDESLPPDEHLTAVCTAFFAPGNDPEVWRDGWHPLVAKAQGAATTAMPVEEWWTAGNADVLVIHPELDVISVIENARDIVDRLGERSTLVTIPDAGHALLPEQPELVATAVVAWLRART